jgi:hypothetical protein
MLGVRLVCPALRMIGFIHAVNTAKKELELTVQAYLLNPARNHLCITSRVVPGM